jgi:hypothetical protein
MVKFPGNNPPSIPAQGPTPVTLAAHRNQTIWQIWLPLGLTVAVILALIVGVILSAAAPTPDVTTLSHWSDVSLIVLVLPVIVGSFFVMIIASGLVYLLARLLKLLPPYTQLGQAYVHYASALIASWCDRVVAPIIRLRGYWAGIQAGFETLRK